MDGQVGFTVIVGGGLGRTPIRGFQVVRDFLPWQDILSYCEAILRVYNRYGRRDNAYKARIKILVQALGIEAFLEQVEAEWAHGRSGPMTITQAEYDRVAARISPPRPTRRSAKSNCRRTRPSSAGWSATPTPWVPGHAAVTLSLKKHGVAPGRHHLRADAGPSPTWPSSTASASCAATSRTSSWPTSSIRPARRVA